MPGTTEGGKKAAQKILQKDPDHYKKIGSLGGQRGFTGGFHHLAKTDPEKFKKISYKGGKISRRKARER